ncbi:MAG: HisA/HisF-related TIM barrel protein, partial [Candidatus Bathyarchaeia archaeon]
QLGNEKILVSLDLLNNKLLSRLDTTAPKTPTTLLHKFQETGVSQIIILDLARVGSEEGINIPLVKEALKNFKGDIYVGGGIRDISDLLTLERIGVKGALIATALHTEKISVKQLQTTKLL